MSDFPLPLWHRWHRKMLPTCAKSLSLAKNTPTSDKQLIYTTTTAYASLFEESISSIVYGPLDRILMLIGVPA